jgi:hypothetical protein
VTILGRNGTISEAEFTATAEQCADRRRAADRLKALDAEGDMNCRRFAVVNFVRKVTQDAKTPAAALRAHGPPLGGLRDHASLRPPCVRRTDGEVTIGARDE